MNLGDYQDAPRPTARNTASFTVLMNSINRAIILDMAIRDIEESLISRQHIHRVSEADIDTLPCTGEEECECAICLESGTNATILNCGHKFCRKCLMTWLPIRNACPMCRSAAIIGLEGAFVTITDLRASLQMLRQLVYAMMCEDARISTFLSDTNADSNSSTEIPRPNYHQII
jgi:hypothetical protein